MSDANEPCICGCAADPALLRVLDGYARGFVAAGVAEETAGPLRRGEKAALDALHVLTRAQLGIMGGARAVMHVCRELRALATPERLFADACLSTDAGEIRARAQEVVNVSGVSPEVGRQAMETVEQALSEAAKTREAIAGKR